MRRELDVTPQLHGGGQERDIRSGTLDTPAVAGFAAAVELAVEHQPERAARMAGLRDDLVRRVQEQVPGGDAATATRLDVAHRLPGNAHLAFPGCEGDSLLMLLDARGIACSTGSACSAGVPQPSHVLLAMGRGDEQARSSLRFSLGHTSTAADVDALVEAIGPVVERARAAGVVSGLGATRGGLRVRVLAAMSGGVDSAVAAARAVDAGHDVTGMHLALSRNPQSYRTGARGCCTIEDSNDARRAADVIGIPFYVWDLSERFHEDVVEDFIAEYAAGRTPNPCLRCNEKIKFAAVLDRALALGFDAVATGHYARLVDRRRRRWSRCTARWTRARTSPTCSACSTSSSSRTRCSRSATRPRRRCAAEAERRGLAVAQKPDSHDICFIADGDTAGLAARAGSAPAPARIVDHATRRGARHPRGRLRLHDRPAQGTADRPSRRRRQAALRARHRAGLRHRHASGRGRR